MSKHWWVGGALVLGVLVVVAGCWNRGILEIVIALSTLATAIPTAIMATVAIRALRVAKYQINASNRSQKEATAIEVYSGYLKLAIDHPEESRRDKYKPEERVSITAPKYDAFVTYLLFAAEEVLDLVPDDQQWKHALKTDLSHHKEFFRSDAFKKEDIGSYSQPLRDLIKEILL